MSLLIRIEGIRVWSIELDVSFDDPDIVPHFTGGCRKKSWRIHFGGSWKRRKSQLDVEKQQVSKVIVQLLRADLL